MKPTEIQRFYFSQEEVIAALFPSGIPSKTRELRIDGDELIVDFVNPMASQPAPEHPTPTAGEQPPAPDDEFPGDRPQTPAPERPAAVGPNENEAKQFCAQRGFQTFLEVKTEEAAERVLLEKTRAKSFGEFDTVKSWRANFRDVVGDYDLWLRG